MDKDIKKEMKKYSKEELIGIIDLATDDIVKLQSKNQQLLYRIHIAKQFIKKQKRKMYKSKNKIAMFILIELLEILKEND